MAPLRILLCCLALLGGPLHGQQHSLRFFGNGTGQIDRVKVPLDNPHRPVDVGGDFTVEFWMRGTAWENQGVVAAQANGDGWITGNVIIDRDVFGSGDFGDWGIAVGNNGRLGFGVDRAGSGLTIITDSGNVLDGAWHHVAVTRANGTGAMAIYVDGARLATGTGPTGDVSYRDGRATSWSNSDPYLVFGAEKHDAEDIYGGSYPSFSGWLDEVRISTSVRYTGAVVTRPDAPFVTDAATTGLWHFDEGSGDQVGDGSGATGGPSHGSREFGGTPNAGPLWSSDSPFALTALVDFGREDFPTASPDANGRHWNNLVTDSILSPTATLPNLLNTAGLPTGVAVSVSSFGAGANTNGSTAPDPAALGALGVASATRDGFFIAAGNTATVTISGLASNGLHRLVFFGSRDAADARTTRFSAQGAGLPVIGTVQTSGTGIGIAPEPNANRAFAAVMDGVQPAAGGQVVVTVSVDGGAFGYLGAWAIERSGTAGNAAPVASAVAWEGALRPGSNLQGRYLFSDADGDAESGTLFQWERSATGEGGGMAIGGAQSPDYTPAAEDAGQYLRLIVTPGAAAGATPGTAAASAWRGPLGATGALSVFHIGNSFTRWGDVPAQLAAFAAARARPQVWGDQIRDGEGLGYHWSNGLPGGVWTRGTPSRTELATASWDALVLQPMSREFLPQNQAAFLANADLFDDLADANGTRLFLYAYWPYSSEPVDTQDAINAAFENVRAGLSTDGPPVRIIPAGEAFRRVSQEVDAGTLTGISRAALYRDDLHPSDAGYYLAALVHYAVIHQLSPVGLPAAGISSDPDSSAPVPLAPALAAGLQRIAWEVARALPASGITRGRFDTWAATNLPAGLRERESIPFADGITNLERWAFGILPADRSGTGTQPAVVREDPAGGVRITYRIGADAEDSGLAISEQWSTDLTDWSLPPPQGMVRERSGEEVVLTIPTPATRLFFRAVAVFPQ